MAPVPMVPSPLRVSRRRLVRVGLLAGAGLLALLAVPAPAVASPLALAQGGASAHSTTAGIGEALAPSGPAQIGLGEHLRQQGYLFYGAWWCPACFQQKNLFGKEAGNSLPYVECDKTDDGRAVCMAAKVRAFPTWVLGNQRLEGVQTVEELKAWSGFPGAGGPTSANP